MQIFERVLKHMFRNDIAIPVKHDMFDSTESEIELEAIIDLDGEPKDEVQSLNLTHHDYFEENEEVHLNISAIQNEEVSLTFSNRQLTTAAKELDVKYLTKPVLSLV